MARHRVAAVVAIVAALVGATIMPAQASAVRRPVVTSMSTHSGSTAGGGRLTVHGRNIGSHLTVSFFGRTTSYRRVSRTTVSIRVPAHATPGRGWLRIRAHHLLSTRSTASTYTYRYPPPVITGMSTHLIGTSGGGDLLVRGRFPGAVTSVSFGTTRGDHVQLTNEGVSVRVPAHVVGRVYVTVRMTSGSTRPTSASALEYYPYPVVTGLSTRDGPVAGGQVVTIRGTAFRAPATVTFGASPATHVRVLGSTSLSAVVPPHGPGVVDVQVTTPVGGSGTSPTPDDYRYGTPGTERWSAPATIDAGHSIRALDCAPDYCLATDDAGQWLARDPGGWSPIPAPADHPGTSALSCVSSTFCMVFAGSFSSVWNGTGWTANPRLTDADGASVIVSQLDCTSASFCAAGSGPHFALWDGTAWTVTSRPPDYFGALSCWADNQCAAIDSSGFLRLLQAGTWVAGGHLAHSDIVGSGACPSATVCLAGSQYGSVSTARSVTQWVLAEPVVNLVCSSGSSCLAVGATTTATWDGFAWTVSSVAPAPIAALSCPGVDSCLAASGQDVRTLTW